MCAGFMRYPARITLTYDDPGLIDGSHQYIQALLPMIQAKGVPLSIAVVTGYDLSQQLDSDVSVVDQCGVGLELPFGVAPILCVSECVHDPVHGDGGVERDAFDFEQAVGDHGAGRCECAGELGFDVRRGQTSFRAGWIRWAE